MMMNDDMNWAHRNVSVLELLRELRSTPKQGNGSMSAVHQREALPSPLTYSDVTFYVIGLDARRPDYSLQPKCKQQPPLLSLGRIVNNLGTITI